MPPQRGSQDRPLALMSFLGGVLLAAFWGLQATGRLTLGEPGSATADFEAAFPFADFVIGVLLLVAGTGLWSGRSIGRFALISGASMVLYLGILDLTFHSRHGLFTDPGGESALEIVVILTCLAGGAGALIHCLRQGGMS